MAQVKERGGVGKTFAFQKKLKKMLLPWTRININCRKLRCVSRTIHDLSVWNKPLIDTCQYCSTNRANQALRSLANAGFQNRRVCLQTFRSFPSPSLSFIFWSSFRFSRGHNRKSLSPIFYCSETKRKRLLRRLSLCRQVETVLAMCSL